MPTFGKTAEAYLMPVRSLMRLSAGGESFSSFPLTLSSQFLSTDLLRSVVLNVP